MNKVEGFWRDRGNNAVLVADGHERIWLIYHRITGAIGRVSARDVKSHETCNVSGQGIDCADLVAVVCDDAVVVVWNQLTDGVYQLFEGSLSGSAPRQITEGLSPAIFPAMAVEASGTPCLVYQTGDEAGSFGIYMTRKAEGQWTAPLHISDVPGNNWCPAIAKTADGKLAVAWDGYASGSYDVYLRFIEPDGSLLPTKRLTGDGSFHAHVTLAPAPDGAVWIAWNRGTPNWGKDNEVYRSTRIPDRNYLHTRRSLEVRRAFPSRILPVYPPVQDFLDATLPGLLHERPQLYSSPAGALYLTFRFNTGEQTGGHRTEKRWQAVLTRYDGESWSECVELGESYGLSTGATSLAATSENAVLAAACGEGDSLGTTRLETTTSLYRLEIPAHAITLRDPPLDAEVLPVPPRAAALLRHTISYKGRELRLYFGDVHRHTELSFCRSCVDGSLEESYRSMKDAAAMDFGMTADHERHKAAPDMWSETMRAADKFHVPGHFTTFFGYEWIGGEDNRRHRNIVSTTRVPVPPFDYVDGHRDVRNTWATLQRGKAITIPHHTACNMSLIWLKDPGEASDPLLEPIVEIFQASRASSEYPGCPTLCNAFYYTGLVSDFNVEGAFVSDALRQGIRMGFIASSDHMSTHRSYACVYARENTREALMGAMLARRVYAATDRIVCEFTVGDAIMGEQIKADEPLHVRIRFIGTGPIREVALLRDSEAFHTYQISDTEADISLALTSTEARGHYFYARMIQRDTNMAWSSPIWVD